MNTIACDVLIVGGGAGGTAAALAASGAGVHVCLLEQTEWLGGQLTTQGVCTPDEQQHIETFGGTSRYYAFRQAIRAWYREHYTLTPEAAANPHLNPGNCWVSRLSFEPQVGAAVLRAMTRPLEEDGRLRIFFRTQALACETTQDAELEEPGIQVTAVLARNDTGEEWRFTPRYVLDATDLGELLPLCGEQGVDWTVGAESRAETGEPDAPNEPRPDWVQPFTFPFALDWSPETAAENVIPPPEDYEQLKAEQKYHIQHGAITGLFAGKMPWWKYRRVLAAENFADPHVPSDLAMINTAGNDYYGGNVIGAWAEGEQERISPPAALEDTEGHRGNTEKYQEREENDPQINADYRRLKAEERGESREDYAEVTLARARRASLGYVYWLQTECPREVSESSPHSSVEPLCPSVSSSAAGGEKGYPEFRLRRDIFGTADGCSIMPYIRESRRIRALRPILEQEIVVKDFQGNVCRGDAARAVFMPDTVGIGHYALDIHPNGNGEPNAYVATRPFQIPLGALVPVRWRNLLPACKNLGVTHLTNGAYRLHPIEWNIGETAGQLAVFCLRHGITPQAAYADATRRGELQALLLQQGIPLHWYIDVPLGHSAFVAVQTLAGTGIPLGSETDLRFGPDAPISPADWNAWRAATRKWETPVSFQGTRAEAALLLCL
ncbi:MAG TPA: FAD-dependent oxidoreductase [Chthonomonadaceae bacterium]|nr:FAD-dependent oxidoreductase [Chthonomonadaceae bacterium]